jgi:D-alanyl-D-alanine carboxypeptidase (penicillin-binding protein 5/6)
MNKMRIFSIFLLVALLMNHGLVSAVPTADSCISLDASSALAGNSQLLPTAQAVVLYAQDGDTMVYSWNPDLRLDPSGMNKIMTALIALETTSLDTMVTVTSTALNSVAIGAMSAGLKTGECLSLKDLLYLMMVGSANDAAAVIAEGVSGSQAAFVGRMNQRALELGCTNTVFVNPSGLSAEGQYSTARDLAKISAAALQINEFVKMFSTVEYIVPATDRSKERKVVTTNYMMSDVAVRDQLDSRITGGKTGALSTTDRSLISTAEKDGQRYLSVVMNAKGTMTEDGTAVRTFGNFKETKLLLDHAFSQYAKHQLLSNSKVMSQFKVDGGENDLAVAAHQAVSALMPNDMKADRVTYRCVENSELKAPISQGDIVGSVELWYDGICVAQSDLVAMHDVKEKGTSAIAVQLQAKENNQSGNKGTILVWCIVAILVSFAGILIGIRMVHIKQYRSRQAAKRRRRR